MNKNKDYQTIYIRMLEGVETFIPVKAKHLKGDLFEIINNEDLDLDLEEDATSIYEFFPGDTVKCEIQSNYFLPIQGKVETFLLASKLISSTFIDRKLYELIFLIVKNFGKVELDKLEHFADEIKRICYDKSIVQRKHPVIQNWIKENCAQ
ncbi:MAG TPA: hypothetical protein VK084_09615 [Chitinophagaceae bacterium]|nr:hypothetical protein [Chitinophagaceae bacterium]